jgi:hypothetical protein
MNPIGDDATLARKVGDYLSAETGSAVTVVRSAAFRSASRGSPSASACAA